MKKQMWYAAGLNKYLSENGYVHFSTKGAVTDDFKEGRAFYFDSEKKEFGLSDMIARENLERASELTSRFRSSGKLDI